jgi:hypothetical protein
MGEKRPGFTFEIGRRPGAIAFCCGGPWLATMDLRIAETLID